MSGSFSSKAISFFCIFITEWMEAWRLPHKFFFLQCNISCQFWYRKAQPIQLFGFMYDLLQLKGKIDNEAHIFLHIRCRTLSRLQSQPYKEIRNDDLYFQFIFYLFILYVSMYRTANNVQYLAL